MAAAPRQKWTVEDYLAFERASADRHEYLDGEIFALVGASENHNLIVTNTVAALHPQLRRPPCRIYANDMRVKVAATGLYTYPDLVVVCDSPSLEDDAQDTLLNPTLIIEVLSPTIESYDRGTKIQHYRTLETLQAYVLMMQESPRIEHFVRQDDGQWLLADAVGLDAALELVMNFRGET